MPGVIEDVGLDLVSADRSDNVVLAQHAASAFSFGENVSVFVRDLENGQTEVEVVSKAAMSTNVLANDWSDDIFEALDERFGK
jgi:hypothetical protein